MSFSRPAVSNRRQVYLALSSSIEGQLRDGYARRHAAGLDTQATLADKIGVRRTAINKRLLGKTNMTTETLADMVWALGYCIDVHIYDPFEPLERAGSDGPAASSRRRRKIPGGSR